MKPSGDPRRRYRMARLTYATFALLAFAACSSKNTASTPDAKPPIDAAPPIDAPPDALVCTPPLMMCTTGACTDTTTDENNCGTCGMVCQGGAFCGPMPTNGACQCPGNFLTGTIAGNIIAPLTFSSFTFDLGLATAGTSNNGLLSIVNASATGATVANMNYTLTGSSFSFPTIAAAYNLTSLNPPTADAYYLATAGTVNYSILCAHEQKGTLKNVTFQGATLSGMNFTVDPNGCTFDVASLDFDISDGTKCP